MTTHHGWQVCRACHAPGLDVRVVGDWHLRANPGYWGSSAPETLVLGFSKGATQIGAANLGALKGSPLQAICALASHPCYTSLGSIWVGRRWTTP